MTGAGSATVAFVKESSFKTLPGTPTYYRPGRNLTVEEAELSNALTRLREDGNEEAVDSLAGTLEGAFSASWVMSNDTHDDVRDIVFNDSGTGFTSGAATSSAWYLGVDHLNGTTERALSGVIPLEYSISYEQGAPIRESATFGYADESTNTSITPSSITGPSDGNDVPFHGAQLDVDANTQTKLQSCTLTFSTISRFHRGPDRIAKDAVLAAPTTTLDATTIFGGNNKLELAYGGSGNTTTQDALSNVSGSLSFSVGGVTVATYTLSKLKPDTYTWQDLVNADADITEPVSYHVNGGISIA